MSGHSLQPKKSAYRLNMVDMQSVGDIKSMESMEMDMTDVKDMETGEGYY